MRRFTFWGIALAIAVIIVFNIQGWFILRRTTRALEQELSDRLQAVATTLSSVLAGKPSAPESRRLLSDVMTRNGLFNLFIVDEDLNYLANARDPDLVGSTDPALALDAAEIQSAFSGIPTRSRLYSARGYYLATSYAPVYDARGILPVGVVGAEADARFFTVMAVFRSSQVLINVLSLLAILAIVLVSLNLVRHALRVEQAAARANTLALMGQMSGAVAHEIRNPLGIIRASAERLQRKFDPARAEPAFGYITEEVDRLNRVITNYLGIGRRKPDQVEAVDLRVLLQDVLASIAPDTSAQGISVESELEGLPSVEGNLVELRPVFLNLVLNAVQAQPSGGMIRVSGRADKRDARTWAVIRIQDHGPGIPVRDRQRVFEPFYTTKEKGSGLGLFVVKRVVEGMRGTVAIEGKPGEGTAVEVRLPA